MIVYLGGDKNAPRNATFLPNGNIEVTLAGDECAPDCGCCAAAMELPPSLFFAVYAPHPISEQGGIGDEAPNAADDLMAALEDVLDDVIMESIIDDAYSLLLETASKHGGDAVTSGAVVRGVIAAAVNCTVNYSRMGVL